MGKYPDVETEFDLDGITIQVKAWCVRELPRTRDYPGEPAHIEDFEITIMDCKISGELFGKLCAKFMPEIEEAVWDQARDDAGEYAVSEAEWRMDSLRDR